MIQIVGGGPAGSAAALAALRDGADVIIHEKSQFPRHKVCGEFLSPEVAPLLESLGAWPLPGAAPIRRALLHFGRARKRWRLDETAYGLSRYTLDAHLLGLARRRGAALGEAHAAATVMAHGRQAHAPRGRRLFGFKAHFSGPAEDAVELYFFPGCYAGVSPVEEGRTNVCGLAPEELLRRNNFEIEAIFPPHLRDRLAPLRREMRWLVTGPLVFSGRFEAAGNVYPAGDALGFVDPFTGSGILAALLTGKMAGSAAVRGVGGRDYVRGCRSKLEPQYRVARCCRAFLSSGVASVLAPLVPGRALFDLTRPRA